MQILQQREETPAEDRRPVRVRLPKNTIICDRSCRRPLDQ